MNPTLEQFLKGSCRWNEKHKEVNILINFHTIGNHGTWCYYLIIPQEMYPHRWKDFACRRKNGYERNGKAFNSVSFQGGITWSSNESYYDARKKKTFKSVKVGCDYAHLWDERNGYPDTYDSVLFDAKKTAEQFLEQNPDRRFKSNYSHKWGEEKDFYIAKNGLRVHKDDDIPEDWDMWKPEEQLEVK